VSVHSDKNKNTSQRSSRWSQEQRLEFIDFRLYWEGIINRSDLTTFFSISVPQASLDLARYIELAPENLEYDRKKKAYFATPHFKPMITPSQAHGYLNPLLGVAMGTLQKAAAPFSEYPAIDVVQLPYRDVPTLTLRTILKAIRQRFSVNIEYQSLTRPDPTVRDISPHAIAFDGRRWHVRAYCHLRHRFQDFLFARMLRIEEGAPSEIDSIQDHEWQTILELKITPHPNLSPSQRRVIELDFGMSNGVALLPVRQALVEYTLEYMGLSLLKPTSQEVILVNENELSLLLN